MKEQLRSAATSPLLITMLVTAGLVEILCLADDTAPLPQVIHPSHCHACCATSPEIAAARDAFLIRDGAVEVEYVSGCDPCQR